MKDEWNVGMVGSDNREMHTSQTVFCNPNIQIFHHSMIKGINNNATGQV